MCNHGQQPGWHDGACRAKEKVAALFQTLAQVTTHTSQAVQAVNCRVPPHPGPLLPCLGGENFLNPWGGLCSSPSTTPGGLLPLCSLAWQVAILVQGAQGWGCSGPTRLGGLEVGSGSCW